MLVPKTVRFMAFLACLTFPTLSFGLCLDPIGDINESGSTNIVDVQCMVVLTLNQLAGNPPPACFTGPAGAADINCDNATNVVDILMTVSSALGEPISPDVDADGSGCADACESCAETEIIDCNGGCNSAFWLGDDFCDWFLNCAELGYDGGDCPCANGDLGACCELGILAACEAACDSGDVGACCELGDVGACCEVGDDWESCVVACSLGDQESCVVACSLGDLGACCELGVPFACSSACWLGDLGACCDLGDLGACELACIELGDQGACASVACDNGDQEACEVVCLNTGCPLTALIGDTTCDPDCNNAECQFDGGDCEVSCSETQMANCNGGCTSSFWLGDGSCDYAFNCAEFGYDFGDCTTPSGCPNGQFQCIEGCIPGVWECDGKEDCPDGADEMGCAP